MMKRIYILVLAILPSLTFAQQLSSALELGVGGGYSSLGYGAASGVENITSSVSGGFSATAHVGYAFYFCPWVGIGVGADWTLYSGATALSGERVWNGMTDTEGEKYNHHLILDGWKEKQNLHFLEVPLSLRLQSSGNKVRVIGELGAKWGLPIASSFRGGGSVTHYGSYGPWALILRNEPNHGFYTETGYHPSGSVQEVQQKWSLYAKLGVAVPVTDQLYLTAQVYGQYALSDVKKVGGNDLPGFINDRPQMENAHYFMQPYTTALSSSIVQGAIRPWNIGLEVGIRYVMTHRKRECYPCMILIR